MKNENLNLMRRMARLLAARQILSLLKSDLKSDIDLPDLSKVERKQVTSELERIVNRLFKQANGNGAADAK